ncbi:uncharacterized protein VP01_3497g1 [Puccinia sorghi]|uniref:GAG-pre-integrase domain-containing protein n=1 Tax=Puccinia sorghi TaxID=27349 RepID=A0A0L6UVW0_9BASI|nr:uncharacterized protein VP01_3497g1 [Puccinia sorghi]
MSLVHKHHVFKTIISNNCWHLLTTPQLPPPSPSSLLNHTSPSASPHDDVVLPSLKNQPAMTSIKWHERLGHANDKLVKTFVQRFVDPEISKNWQPFFSEQCAISKSNSRRFLPPLGKEAFKVSPSGGRVFFNWFSSVR